MIFGLGRGKLPAGIETIKSLRITQFQRATAHHNGDVMSFPTISADSGTVYGARHWAQLGLKGGALKLTT